MTLPYTQSLLRTSLPKRIKSVHNRIRLYVEILRLLFSIWTINNNVDPYRPLAYCINNTTKDLALIVQKYRNISIHSSIHY